MAPHFKDKDLSTNEKKKILGEMEGKGKREVEKLVQELWGEDQVLPKEKVKLFSKTQLQITLTIDDETLKMLQELKETLVHKGVKDLSGVVKELCRQSQKQKEKPIKERVSKVDPCRPTTRAIPANIKRQVLKSAQGACEFTCAGKVPRVCGSKFGLAIDHVRPYSLGGTHELSNLRLLCHHHHARETFKDFGKSTQRVRSLRA